MSNNNNNKIISILNDHETLFWKVYRNSYLRNKIYLNFTSNEVHEISNPYKYNLGYRIQFNKLNNLEWFIRKNEIRLLIYFINNDNEKLIVASNESIRLLFSKYYDRELLSTILLSKSIQNKSSLDLIKIALEFNNINALIVVLDEMKVKASGMIDRYLLLCKSKELFKLLFNQMLKEMNIDLNRLNKVHYDYIKMLFKGLINVSRFHIENVLDYLNIIDMTGTIEYSFVYFNIGDLDIMKKVLELNIYNPKESNVANIDIRIRMDSYKNNKDTYYRDIIDKLLLYLKVLFKYHLKSNKSSSQQLYENEFNEINNYLNDGKQVVNQNEMEFKYINILINILNNERSNFNIEIINQLEFINGLIFLSYKTSTLQYPYYSSWENMEANILIYEQLNTQVLKSIKLHHIHSYSNPSFKLPVPLDYDRLKEFIGLHKSTRLPQAFVKSIVEILNIDQLNEMLGLNLLLFQEDICNIENDIYRFGDIDKIKWFIKKKYYFNKKEGYMYAFSYNSNNDNQPVYYPFKLNSIDDIKFIKEYQSVVSNGNSYPDFNSLDVLVYYSNNLTFNCIKDMIKVFKSSPQQQQGLTDDKVSTVLVPWINHLNDIKFKCFNLNSFRSLILNLLEIFNDDDQQFINLNIGFNLKCLSQFTTYLFITSLFNLNLRLLNLLIKHYKISIDYEFIKHHKFKINSIYKNNHHLDTILEVSRLLFNNLSSSDLKSNLLNPIFNNLYHRVLLCDGISLNRVYEIKNEFINNQIDIIDSKNNIHHYLIIKSNRFTRYIQSNIDPLPLKILNSLKIQLNETYIKYNQFNNGVANNGNHQIHHSAYRDTKFNLLNTFYSNDLDLINIIKSDFNSLFIKLSNEIKTSLNSDIKYLFNIHNLNLIESILIAKPDHSDSIQLDLNKLNQFFNFNNIENILLQLKRVNK